MKAKFGVLSALTFMLVATTAEANFTVAGEFAGIVDYLSGAPEFFQTTNVAAKVAGTVTLNATNTRSLGAGVVEYSGPAVYALSLYNMDDQLFQRFSGTGNSAYLNVSDGPAPSAAAPGFGISGVSGGAWGSWYSLSSFSVSGSTTAPARFQLAFQSVDGKKKPGSIQGDLTATPLVTYGEPLPTPVPAALPLLASGLVGLGCLRRRSLAG